MEGTQWGKILAEFVDIRCQHVVRIFVGLGSRAWLRGKLYFYLCHWSQDMKSIMSGCIGEVSHKRRSDVTTEAAYDSCLSVMWATEMADVGKSQ